MGEGEEQNYPSSPGRLSSPNALQGPDPNLRAAGRGRQVWSRQRSLERQSQLGRGGAAEGFLHGTPPHTIY